MCLLISHRGSSFCPCILYWTYVFISVKCKARLFRVTPIISKLISFYGIENQWLKFEKKINRQIVHKHLCILFLKYIHRKWITDRLQTINNEGCSRNLHVLFTILSQRMKVNFVFTDCRIKIIFLFACL
jgi:hypothetical protein